MKQRITYLLPEGHRVNASDILVQDDSLSFADASKAAEEWRLTLGLDELPEEIQVILADCHELHLRWTSPENRSLRSPLVAGVPSGLHAFYTPRAADQHARVCDLINQLLDGPPSRCHSVTESWTRPSVLSERFAASSSYQYYHYWPLRRQLGEVFLTKACAGEGPGLAECDRVLDELGQADYIDVDFDVISHAVTLTALWSSLDASKSPLLAQRVSRPIRKTRTNDRVEVGVLHPEEATEPEKLSLGGFLTVIGDNNHPGMTLFSFPARHHPLPPSEQVTFKATFEQPIGLHPDLKINIPQQNLIPPKEQCGLHAYWTLPSGLFIDRYQLSDPLFLASNNLLKLHSLSGEQDLEAPDWVIKRWGSAALLELAAPPAMQSDAAVDDASEWTVTIPTHLRYLAADSNGTDSTSHTALKVPWPILFWACEAEEGLKMATNPFDRVNLGYDGLFGPKTMFYHISPAGGVERTVEEIKVPVLDVEKAEWVPMGTLLAVAVGFSWVCWKLIRGADGRVKEKDGKKAQ
ncbi:protease B nonderepressible form [Saxophila tyrrhenica]|uniref:Protein PBN1 n=1 Tax=Saxophila tyrrhenica TaxID=1690608 RepID=A0AAV9P7G4_9PEZI|nr:protease B nonderepressible form [Saxophila tyrrhenica]